MPDKPKSGEASNFTEGFFMYSVDSLEYAVRRLFQGGIGGHGHSEEVESMLHGIDFDVPLQAVRHNAETVHAYITDGKTPLSFNYRGKDMFGQRAPLIDEDNDQSCASVVLPDRTYELWLLEDIEVAAVACVSLACKDGEYVTEHRETKEEDLWGSTMCLNLEELVRGGGSYRQAGCFPFSKVGHPHHHHAPPLRV